MLQADLDNELDLKEKEVEWIDKVGKALLTSRNGEPKLEALIGDNTLRVQQRWDEIKELWEGEQKIEFYSTFTKKLSKYLISARVAKMREDRMTAKRLNEDLVKLRDWIRDPEQILNRPVYMLNTEEREYKKKRKEYLVGRKFQFILRHSFLKSSTFRPVRKKLTI